MNPIKTPSARFTIFLMYRSVSGKDLPPTPAILFNVETHSQCYHLLPDDLTATSGTPVGRSGCPVGLQPRGADRSRTRNGRQDTCTSLAPGPLLTGRQSHVAMRRTQYHFLLWPVMSKPFVDERVIGWGAPATCSARVACCVGRPVVIVSVGTMELTLFSSFFKEETVFHDPIDPRYRHASAFCINPLYNGGFINDNTVFP